MKLTSPMGGVLPFPSHLVVGLEHSFPPPAFPFTLRVAASPHLASHPHTHTQTLQLSSNLTTYQRRVKYHSFESTSLKMPLLFKLFVRQITWTGTEIKNDQRGKSCSFLQEITERLMKLLEVCVKEHADTVWNMNKCWLNFLCKGRCFLWLIITHTWCVQRLTNQGPGVTHTEEQLRKHIKRETMLTISQTVEAIEKYRDA